MFDGWALDPLIRSFPCVVACFPCFQVLFLRRFVFCCRSLGSIDYLVSYNIVSCVASYRVYTTPSDAFPPCLMFFFLRITEGDSAESAVYHNMCYFVVPGCYICTSTCLSFHVCIYSCIIPESYFFWVGPVPLIPPGRNRNSKVS